jgi:PAS domain S-box-containing protein
MAVPMAGENLFLLTQLILTVFLVGLLWSLHARLRRQEFFWWWACGWTSFALFLASAFLTRQLAADWAVLKAGVYVLMGLAGFAQIPLLLFGALSLRPAGPPERWWQRVGVGLALATGAAIALVSLVWRDQPAVSFSIRQAPRMAGLAAALLVCAVVFLRRWRTNHSWASGVTGGFCLLYAVDQTLYGVALVGHLLFDPKGIPGSLLNASVNMVGAPLFVADLVSSCGICLGIVLLLVEEHQRAERDLLYTVSRSQEIADKNAALVAEIEERRRVEQALRESEDRYRDLVDHSEDLICTHDLEGRLLSANPGPARILGYDVGELLRMTVRDLLRPQDYAHFDDYLAAIKRDGVAKGRMSVLTRAGNRRVWEYHSSLRTDGVQSPIVRGVAHDITDRFRAEQALKVSATALTAAEARHRAILKALPDWVFLMTGDGVFLDFHAKDPSDLLVPPDVFLGKNIGEVLPPELAESLARCFNEAMATGGPCALEYTAPSHGDTRFYEARVVRCDSDKVLSVVRDITERIRAEDEVRRLRDALAHVGRVSMLGALTGSLAHEINQPLAAISVNAQAGLNLVASGQTDVHELREAMSDIIADSQRAGDVLHRLRDLLTKGTTEHAPLDLTTLIGELLLLVRGEIVAHRILLDVDLEECVPFVLGDRVQIQQVVLNLLLNAIEGVRELELAHRRVILRMRTIGSEVIVSVGDDGLGLSDDQLPQIFEPFYTTKAGGMGLGLAICRAIVMAHGGTLTAERNPNRGMTFSFRLYAAEPPGSGAPAMEPAVESRPA